MENNSSDNNLNRPTHEQISALALALWQQRGCPDGTAESDWLEAETTLLEKLNQQTLSMTATQGG